jgi:predicted lipoprotein with Yx(FWY)xxD motif
MLRNVAVRRRAIFRSITSVFGVLASCLGVSSFGSEEASLTDGPALIEMTAFGPVLAAPGGGTLYWWLRDETTPGSPQCNNNRESSYKHVTGQTVYLPHPDVRKTCEDKWPPFHAADDARPEGKWTIVERHDNSRQWAYEGRPMHRSIKDRKAGDANGVNVIERSYGGWQLAMAPLDMPPGVELLRLREGLALVLNGRALYTPRAADSEPCVECGKGLEPLAAGALVKQVGEWSVIEGAGGFRQYAFRDQPIFVGPDAVTGPDPEPIEGWDAVYFEKALPLPAAIETRFSLIADIYTTQDGMALYVFSCQEGPESVPCDDPGDAAAHWAIICGTPDLCVQRWQPYVAEAGSVSIGEWSVMEVPSPVFTDPRGFTYAEDNNNPVVSVWAYRGRPVYTFVDDDEPALVLGHEMTALPGSGFFAIQAAGNHEKTLSR